MRVAHVVTATGINTRPVDLGESQRSHGEIVAGLHEGERVSLTAAFL